MGRYHVTGGRRLAGELAIQGGKNAVLPILAASVLGLGESVLTNCPNISDTRYTLKILEEMGCKVTREGGNIAVDSRPADTFQISDELARKMRSSVIFVGSLLSRFGAAKVSYPGGCVLGLRPIDLHLKGLRMLGARIDEEQGFLNCTAQRLVGADIALDFPSVGATQNIMLAAVMAEGTTRLINAAKEPEIVELANFLNAMGARVRGAGETTIEIDGVTRLIYAEHRVMPDRIVAGTYLAAAAMTRGELTLTNVSGASIRPVVAKLVDAGCRVSEDGKALKLRAPNKLCAIHLKTQPHPGFPTDLQPQFTAMLSVADGLSVIEETVFDARNNHIPELNSMGADILQVNGNMSLVQGVEKLCGSPVASHDLRGGAALILAGLAAEGETIVEPADHVQRGYENIEADLSAIGADIAYAE